MDICPNEADFERILLISDADPDVRVRTEYYALNDEQEKLKFMWRSIDHQLMNETIFSKGTYTIL